MFAAMLIVMTGITGLAVDCAKLYHRDSKLQSAADAAVLSAAALAEKYVADNGIQNSSAQAEIQSQAETAVRAYFQSDSALSGVNASDIGVTVTIADGHVQVAAMYTGSVPTNFAKIVGVNSLPYTISASAVASTPPFVDVYILADTSGSMAFGASPADQQFLVTQTGCAFACHDGSPVLGYPDAYAFAMAKGVTLRNTALKAGIHSLLDEIDSVDPGHRFISTAVYAFDNALTNPSPLTTDTSATRRNMPADPAISGMTAGATHFKEIIDQVVIAIGPGGDGKTPSTAVKLLILATDGAQDPGRYWTTDVPARDEVDAFDMSFCQPLKDSGVNVGIIHTPYIPMTYDWGYNATLGQPSKKGGGATRADDIAPAMQDCAGSRYVLADDTSTIKSAFTKIFNSISGIYLSN